MKLGPQIITLKEQGKSYSEIANILQCSLGTISYHLGSGQKIKTIKRQNLRRSTNHPFQKKLEKFRYESKITSKLTINPNKRVRKILTDKILNFHRDRKTKMYNPVTFTVEDVIAKFGTNPKCYLTGDEIDIKQPRTYQFDHIVPIDKNGDNSLDNLGITTRDANMAKNNMTEDEFISLCKKVLIHNGYEVKLTQ